MTYVKRIRDLREDHDKTQEDIARVLGTSQTMYARYERGANEMPLHHFVAICKLYNVSADYLLGRSMNRDGTTILNAECLYDVSTEKDNVLQSEH